MMGLFALLCLRFIRGNCITSAWCRARCGLCLLGPLLPVSGGPSLAGGHYFPRPPATQQYSRSLRPPQVVGRHRRDHKICRSITSCCDAPAARHQISWFHPCKIGAPRVSSDDSNVSNCTSQSRPMFFQAPRPASTRLGRFHSGDAMSGPRAAAGRERAIRAMRLGWQAWRWRRRQLCRSAHTQPDHRVAVINAWIGWSGSPAACRPVRVAVPRLPAIG